MRKAPRILIADDNAANVKVLKTRLAAEGYEVVTAGDGEQALAMALETKPDLILLDVMMPKVDGLEVCRRLKADASSPFVPIIMVTAMTDPRDVVAGLEAGGDDYLTKPVDHAALAARVRSMLRIKSLHDTVESQARALAELNRTLERRVDEQVGELERIGRLKRFFSPPLADAIVAGGAEDPLVSHRRDISVVFVDLRGFTAFAEVSEPEEVTAVLREYHAALGELILAHDAMLERFTGDGLMVFFNDPVRVDNPEERAVRLAMAMRDRVRDLLARWRRRGCTLDFAGGVASGYATVGAIGFEGRWDYAAIGTVTNLAARLCAEAPPGEVLASQRIVAAVEDVVVPESIGTIELKGFHRPVAAYRLVTLRSAVAA